MNYLLFDYPFADDWRKWDCISLEINVPKDTTVDLNFTVYPLLVGRPEYIISTSSKITVVGEGWQKVEVAFSQFDCDKAAGAFWRFIKKAVLNIQGLPENISYETIIRNVFIKQKGILSIDCSKFSLSSYKDSIVSYEYLIKNQSEKVQAVSIITEKLGWESMQVELIPNNMILKPGEEQKCILKVNIGDRVAPGGYEKQKLIITPNGDINFSKELEFNTVCKLPHPYLLHDENSWQEVSGKVENYSWAKQSLDEYIEIAEKWQVPKAKSGSFAFDSSHEHKIQAASIAWKLTKRREFGEKIAILLKNLADPENGYPATSSSIFHALPVSEEFNNESTMIQKICSGALVHEGGFFTAVATAYDLIYDEGFLNEEEKDLIEKSLYIFIKKIDWAITDGDCNNIPSGAASGALFCSLALQDMHWIHRFIYGTNGIVNFLGATLLDDGWYFETATNYVLLGAEIYTQVAQALLPWGINLKDAYIPAKYSKNIMLTPWSFKTEHPFLGMSFERLGPVNKNHHRIEDFWDGLLPFVDYRGILFSMGDSTEKDVCSLYELPYYMYRKPEYASILKKSKNRSLLYGVPELPEVSDIKHSVSVCADNVGAAMLRSQKEGRKQSEQLQVVLRYGIHGGYHGHFDRTDLVSVMRYGKSIYNTECSWYGYTPYMFKMWVQNSISHNMITVDQKMQEPTASDRLMFFSGKHIQATAVETVARWCDPPYGGQTPYPEKFPEEKTWIEGRYIPIPAVAREQGSIGDYSEPIKQRRMVAVTDDYVLIADWITSQNEHEFDNWLHLPGFKEISGKAVTYSKHTDKFNEDAYGGGQFITDCDWYTVQSPTTISFGYNYNKELDSKKMFTRFNEDGFMNMDVHSLWPLNSEIILGNTPEVDTVNKKLIYEITGDGKLLAEGKFGAWILGKDLINLNIEGIKELEIKVWSQDSERAKKTLFLGDPFILTEHGEKIYVCDLDLEKNNLILTQGSDKDYYGGSVKLEGTLYEKAIGVEPADLLMPSSIKIDLSKIKGAIEFNTVIGGDYPTGNEDKQRKSLSIRAHGKEAKYITILELHQNNKLIACAEAIDENNVKVILKDGRIQEIKINNFYDNDKEISISIKESINGTAILEETSYLINNLHIYRTHY